MSIIVISEYNEYVRIQVVIIFVYLPNKNVKLRNIIYFINSH